MPAEFLFVRYQVMDHLVALSTNGNRLLHAFFREAIFEPRLAVTMTRNQVMQIRRLVSAQTARFQHSATAHFFG